MVFCGYCFGFCFCFRAICVEHLTTMNDKQYTCNEMMLLRCLDFDKQNNKMKLQTKQKAVEIKSAEIVIIKLINKLRQLFQFRLFYYVLLNELKFISCIFSTLDWMLYPAFQRSSSFHFDLPLPLSLTHSLSRDKYARVFESHVFAH